MTIKQAALDYAKRGFEIIPVRPNKTPYTSHGVKDATTREDIVEHWWTMWPDAMIGIRCTMQSPTPFGYVLDVDVSGDKSGDETLKQLEKEYEPLPPTLTSQTATGGKHYIFHSDNPDIKGIPGFAPYLDFRARGNYIIAPPSIREEGTFTWLNNLPPAPLPTWLESLLISKGSFSTETLRNAVDAGFMDGQRNDGLFRKAASLMARGVSYPDAKQLVFAAAAKSNPPMDENEALNCLNSAYGNDGYTKAYRLEIASLADRFADDYKNYVRFLPPLNQWVMWNNRYWENDTLMEVQNLARAIPEKFRKEMMELDPVKDEKQLKRFVQFIKQITHFSVYSRIPQHAGPQMAIHPNDCNKDDFMLGVENGVINLKTGELIQGNEAKAMFITHHSFVQFDPTATAPKFLKFIDEIFGGDKELINYIQRFIGYTLTGSSRERAILILHGNGSNGKSLFLKVLRDMMGSYSRILNAAVLMKSKNADSATGPDANIASLAGRRFIMTSETGNHQRLNENLIKQLTGDEPLSARAPYAREAIEFPIKFKMFMATNHKPYIDDVDPAIWSRVKMIPFLQRFLEPEDCIRENHHPINKALYNELVKELSGILNWALTGCHLWQESGLQEPDIVRKATEAFKSESDLLSEWREDFTVEGPTEETSGADLYNSYTAWCMNNSTRPMTRNAFSRRISEIEGVERGTVNRQRGFIGIAVLKPKTEDKEDMIKSAIDRAENLSIPLH